eukprot:22697-Pelagococcus_subviridis.AAC.3
MKIEDFRGRKGGGRSSAIGGIGREEETRQTRLYFFFERRRTGGDAARRAPLRGVHVRDAVAMRREAPRLRGGVRAREPSRDAPPHRAPRLIEVLSRTRRGSRSRIADLGFCSRASA